MNKLARITFIYSFFNTLFLFLAFSSFAAAPSNGKWIPVGSMATRRVVFSSTLLQNGKVLIAGGLPSTNEPLIPYAELYDPTTKTWSTTGNLNTPRTTGVDFPRNNLVTLKNGKALLVGGTQIDDTAITNAELYDPNTGQWTPTGSLNTARRDFGITVLNDGRVLVSSGVTGSISGTILKTAELYDSSTGNWTYTTNNLIAGRDGATAVKLPNGKVLLISGHDANGALINSAEVFDPLSNTWSYGGDMPFGTDRPQADVILPDGRLFVAAYSGDSSKDAAIYDPLTNSWTLVASMPIPSNMVSGFLLDNGQVLVRSGSQDVVSTPFDEVYDPATNIWIVTNLLPNDNVDGSFTQLANGDILMMGGFKGGLGLTCGTNSTPNCTLNTAELFTSQDLTVPPLKQTDPTWGSQEYDSGELWAGDRGTIGGFGCAMTSAAMVFKYYGITKLPDNTDLDPGTLNTWLKNQADGYVGEGLLNWLALTRLSKLAKLNNPGFMYNGLEFNRSGTDSSTLINDINHSQPDILEEPGHFIVGKGINGTTFDINDPYYNRSDLNNTAYNNSFLSLERFTPSYTDLSYMMLTVNPNVTLTIKTSSGSAVGTQFIQQPLGDALNNSTPSGKPLKIFYLPKPKTGTYTVTLSSSIIQQYQLGTYLYDINGNVVTTILNGTVSTNNPESFTLSFNTQNTNASSITKIVTFQSTLADITEAESLGQISHGPATALTALLNTAKNSEDKDQTFVASVKLDSFEGLLYVFRGRGISEDTFQILLYDAEYLKNHL